MTTEQLRSQIRAQPFVPFTIRMADGRRFDITHPDFIAQSPAGRTVIVFREDESFSILDLLLMTEIEVRSAPGPAA